MWDVVDEISPAIYFVIINFEVLCFDAAILN